MSLEIYPYKRELLDSFEYNGIEQHLSGSKIADIVDFYASLGDCFVGFVNGKAIGVAGLYPMWKNAGGVFAFLNTEASQYKTSVFKALLEYMPKLIEKYNITYMMANCIDDVQAIRLLTHLGFIKMKEVKMGLYFLGGK